ncbi:MAG: MBL fold metallo-hydrolase [Acidimicrobiales bacterium]
MCGAGGHGHDHLEASEAASAAPRPAAGAATDPIRLEEVDELVITALVDNSFDALLGDSAPARRPRLGQAGTVAAPQFEGGRTSPGLMAEHGFSALVTARRGTVSHTVLFDTGVSPDGLATNMERLGISASDIEAIVLSHGHFDHAGGFPGLSRLRGRGGLPLTLHPLAFSHRRIVAPGMSPFEIPTLSRTSLASEGFEVIERRWPSALLDGMILVTGEIDRTTDFEQGMPFHERLGDNGWEPDPLITDDQAIVVRVRGLGTVVLTGCGHAGAVNIARHAMRLTGTDTLHALMGGFHLSGAAFEPIVEPTVAALVELGPALLVPAHCTGWKAQHRLAAKLPAAFVPNSVGTTYTLTAA